MSSATNRNFSSYEMLNVSFCKLGSTHQMILLIVQMYFATCSSTSISLNPKITFELISNFQFIWKHENTLDRIRTLFQSSFTILHKTATVCCASISQLGKLWKITYVWICMVWCKFERSFLSTDGTIVNNFIFCSKLSILA